MSKIEPHVSCPMFRRLVPLKTACRGERATGVDPCSEYVEGVYCLLSRNPIPASYCINDCPHQRGSIEEPLCGAAKVLTDVSIASDALDAGLPGVPITVEVSGVRAQSAARHLCKYPRVLQLEPVETGDPFLSAADEQSLEV